MGDILLTTPIIAHLSMAYPEAQIDFAVKEKFAPFIKDHPKLNRIFEKSKLVSWQKLFYLIRAHRKRYDLIVDLQSNLKSRLLSFFLKSPLKRRYKKPYLNRILLTFFKINRYQKQKSLLGKERYPTVVEHYYRAIADLTGVPLIEPVNVMGETPTGKYKAFMRKPYVVIAPGSRWFTKRWPIEYFISLASKILEKNTQIQILWLGGTDEAAIFQLIQSHPYMKRHEKRMAFSAGELPPTQIIALAEQAQLAVTNDSGLMHLLTAGGRPLYAVFLSTVEQFGFFPFSKTATVLQAENISCRPCNHKGLDHCPKRHFKCALDLSADRVYEAIKIHIA